MSSRKVDSDAVVSTNNSTLLNTQAGNVFVGGFEETTQFSVACITIIRSPQDEGVLYIDQSVDDKGRFSYTVAEPFNASTPFLVTSLCGSKYMRLRLQSNTAIANGYVQTIYHKQKSVSDSINTGTQHVVIDALTTAATGLTINAASLFTTALVVGQSAQSNRFVNLAVEDDGTIHAGNAVAQQMTGTTAVFNTKSQVVGQSGSSGRFVNLGLDDAGALRYPSFASDAVTGNSGVWLTKALVAGASGGNTVNLALDGQGCLQYPSSAADPFTPASGVFDTRSEMYGMTAAGTLLPLKVGTDGALQYELYYHGNVSDPTTGSSGQNTVKAVVVGQEQDGSFRELRSAGGTALVTLVPGNAIPVSQANAPWLTQQVGNVTVQGSAVALPSSAPYLVTAAQTLPVVQTSNVGVYASNALPVLQANGPWSVRQANVPWLTQQVGNLTVQGSAVALPSSTPYLVAAAQTLPVVHTSNVGVYASNALPVLQANGPWSVCQANVPWLTQQVGNVTVQGSAVALPSSAPYLVAAAQTLPVLQTSNVTVQGSTVALPSSAPYFVAAAQTLPVLQTSNVTVQGSAVALPSSAPYLVAAAQTVPVVQTSTVGVYASNALPVLQANVPWLTQQVGNLTVQGSAVALPSTAPYLVTAAQTIPVVQTSNVTVQGSTVSLPSSAPYLVTAAQTLPVVQTSNVGIYASNALPVLQANGPWSVCQANVPWLTQQVGNLTVEGAAVALPSSTPYLVTAAQTLPVVQTSNVGIYASNALPVLQANGPWSVCQANVPWLTQQVGNLTVEGAAVALPSSTPYLVTAAQTLPVVQTSNVTVQGSAVALPSSAPYLVTAAQTVPVVQTSNVTVQGSAVALPSSTPYLVTAAQTLPVVQTSNVTVQGSAVALPSSAPYLVTAAQTVPVVQTSNVTVQGSAVALPSSAPYLVAAAQTLPVVQTSNVGIYASNALPVLQANGPWSVCQANVPWLTQQVGNLTVDGSAIALPSSAPYLVTAAQTLPVVQTSNVTVQGTAIALPSSAPYLVTAAQTLPVVQTSNVTVQGSAVALPSSAPYLVTAAQTLPVVQTSNVTVQGSAVALPSSTPYLVTAAQTLPVVQTSNVGIYASNALPVLQANGPWSVCQANVPWLTQQVGNLTVQGSAVALPSSTPYLVAAAQTVPVVQTSNVCIYASNALPVLQGNGPWSVCQANVPWLTQQVGNLTVQGSAVALPSSSPYLVTAAQTLPVVQTSNVTVQGSAVALPSSTPYLVSAAQTLPVVQTSNVGIYASNALPVLQANGPWSVTQANVPWLTQQVGNVTVQGSAVALPSSTPYLVTAAQTLPVVQTSNVTVQGSAVALPSSTPYLVTAAQTLPVVQTSNVGVYASNALPVLQANGPWSVLQANVPWLTQQVGNLTVQGSAVALPSSTPYLVTAAQTVPVVQTSNVTVEGSAVALPSSAPYLVTAAQTLPVVQTSNVAVYASNALPVRQAGGPWSVAQANVPWLTQQVGNLTVQGSAVALPSSTPYLVTAAQTLPVLQTSNVGVYASNALPVTQANVPWLTQQVGNLTVQGSAVALPSSAPYSVTAAQVLPVVQTSNVTVQGSAVALPSSAPYLVTAAQTLPVVQTSNVGVYASNALPVLQANGPWSVLQANAPWLTQQVGNLTVQGAAVALPSSTPYLVAAAQTLPVVQTSNVTVQGSAVAIPSSAPYSVTAAQTLPVVQTSNVGIYASNALPVLQANGPWSVLQANVPWLTQQVGNVTVQGSAVALPSSAPYLVTAAQTLPVVQTSNVGIYASNALPVTQANAPWLTQQVGNVTVQGSAVAVPSSAPYLVTAAQTLPVLQTSNVGVYASNALPVLQANGPWSVLQANVPWLTQQVGNMTVQGSAVALPSSAPYLVTAAQTLPVVQTSNVGIYASNALPVLQANGPWSVTQANVFRLTQQVGNVTVQGSAVALPSSAPYSVTAAQVLPVVQTSNVVVQGSAVAIPSSAPYLVTAAQTLPVVQTSNVGIYASNALPVTQANVPWLTQQVGNMTVQGSAVALPSSTPYLVTAAQVLPVVQTSNVTVQGSAVALPSSTPYPVTAAQTLPVVLTSNVVGSTPATRCPCCRPTAPGSRSRLVT